MFQDTAADGGLYQSCIGSDLSSDSGKDSQDEQAEGEIGGNDMHKEGTDMQINVKISQVKIQMTTDISQSNQS